MEVKYYQILKMNRELGSRLKSKPKLSIKVYSNIIVSQIKEILEYYLRDNGINSEVNIGDYNNIVQNSERITTNDYLLVIWDLANIIDGFYYKAEVLPDDKLNELISDTKNQIDLVLSNCKDNLVLFTTFSSLIFTNSFFGRTNLDRCAKELNDYLFSKSSKSLILIDIDKIISRIGIDNAINLRDFYNSKMLYTITFYKYLAKTILPIFKSLKGQSKKALVLDCDNTLWKGIVGEDGVESIKMSSNIKGGQPFEEVQYLIKHLSKKGVIIGLNSKNNESDVIEVIDNHPDFLLKDDLVIKKINWNDKTKNLEEIAKEINIGIDSIVFVDDSSFEISMVNKLLPNVETLEASDIYQYPWQFRELLPLFYNIHNTEEDINRSRLYKDDFSRKLEKTKFTSIDEFWESLQLNLSIYKDDTVNISRIAQLTQKTNQFNLTTKRYSEQDIIAFMNSKNSSVFSISVSDKFGDMGITGVAIVKLDFNNQSAIIDSFLMSCRIIGRNFEYKFMNEIISIIQKLGINKIYGSYYKTNKNEQVQLIYDKLGFNLIEDNKELNQKTYELEARNFIGKDIFYIKVNHGKDN